MSKPMSHFYSAEDEWLAAYSAGALSEAKRLVIECQLDVKPALSARVDRMDWIGGAFLESAKGEALSPGFSARLQDAIRTAGAGAAEPRDERDDAGPAGENWAPKPLLDFLARSDIALRWRKSGPGVERAVLFEEDGERLYLLKARPGLKMPLHSHRGQEWTLILQGGYHVGAAAYGRGDLHCEDESCTHQPIIDDHGEVCISLVADEGKLVFRDPVVRLIQPFIGI